MARSPKKYDFPPVTRGSDAESNRALKLTRALLAEDRDNYNLWIAYARLERRRGRFDSARDIYSTALNDVRGIAKLEISSCLWSEWAMMEWEKNEHRRCQGVLIALVNGHSTSEQQFIVRRSSPAHIQVI